MSKTQKPEPAGDAAASAAAMRELPEGASEKQAPAEKTGGYCSYIGPPIWGSILYGDVFPGSKADALERHGQLIQRFPLVADLIVPGSKLQESRNQAKTPGTLLNAHCSRLAAQISSQRAGTRRGVE